MLDIILNALQGASKELIVLVVAALPIAELRGSIPLGLYFGMTLPKAFIISVLGNLLPIVPALFLLDPVSRRLRKLPLFARFFDWLFARAQKNSGQIQKYEVLGLAIFVGIPLPMTGAWSGAIAASLLKMRFRDAMVGIITGVLMAGGIVSILCQLGMLTWKAVVK